MRQIQKKVIRRKTVEDEETDLREILLAAKKAKDKSNADNN